MSAPDQPLGDALTDYGRVHGSRGGHRIVCVAGIDEAQALVAEANRLRSPLRIRGGGHSMNGSSIPRVGEVLVSSSGLRHIRFDRELTVTVGAGAAVWDVDQLLRRHGFQLLLRNDGGAAAATVGGFASAGGIGVDTSRHGGYWETVEDVLLVAGSGEVIRCRAGDELFPWIFGSMGQLGLIVEATLRIEPVEDTPPAPYPVGVQGSVAPSDPWWEHHVWFTLFVPEEATERAQDQLEKLALGHEAVWAPLSDYRYFVRFRTFNPPLLYPRQESFAAVGIWGTARPMLSDVSVAGLRSLSHDFAALVASEPAYRRYVQSELTFAGFDFPAYFGKEVFDGFYTHKVACDPLHLLGRGSVFA